MRIANQANTFFRHMKVGGALSYTALMLDSTMWRHSHDLLELVTNRET